ncbi:DUF5681 domain-containing protein [Sphingobium phenoxybenzoativorans]|uniref:DUF5681 domain-containing protein n=1 Tax=Sphingobium phenoxybenzoativorans TaxID=1592790 RepID=UPI00087219CA|nr:DUF5681 domain-containing protein [Sphingobium phenoxybenzoativorans]
MTARKADGRFKQGVSGNTKGRPKSTRKELRTLADFDRVTLKVANQTMLVKTAQGKEETISRFEANLRALANGSAENRLGCKNFIQFTREAAAEETARLKRQAIREEYDSQTALGRRPAYMRPVDEEF